VRARTQQTEHPIAFEPLGGQLPVESRHLAFVGDHLTPSQTTIERLRKHGVEIELTGNLLDGRICRGRGDPRRSEPLAHSQQTALPGARLDPRYGTGHARIINRPFALETVDRFIDSRRIEGFTGEPLTDLRFRKLTPCEHPNGRRIRVIHG
jgi:hypothetical protein